MPPSPIYSIVAAVRLPAFSYERHPLSLDELRLKSVLNHEDNTDKTSPPAPGPVKDSEWKLVDKIPATNIKVILPSKPQQS